MKSILLL